MKLILAFGIFVCLGVVSTSTVNKKVCSQPVSTGPCRASQPQFFFDPEIGDCNQFLYGGCGGNDNRFDNLKECRKLCVGAESSEESDEVI
ncbi:unnamed protein product [Hermetia illucens]|uniref:BPTI/Kunitz inhibitor domain-containing protein n=1 Tax=Hermetia illucens TaxID=343691 RepID=A0A7R8YY08_HERIL|nr:protease inhibitor-like isoform X2 [Hermetia illucens]CAD7086340.1 unnamed protein product [Hermetia illucens]